jgi:hypothetical protein
MRNYQNVGYSDMVVSYKNRTVRYGMIEVRLKVTSRAYM